MRQNKSGYTISLRNELSDAITENLPRSDEIDSFYETLKYEGLLDEAIEVIKTHLDAGILEGLK